jgi:hypothetical protein
MLATADDPRSSSQAGTTYRGTGWDTTSWAALIGTINASSAGRLASGQVRLALRTPGLEAGGPARVGEGEDGPRDRPVASQASGGLAGSRPRSRRRGATAGPGATGMPARSCPSCDATQSPPVWAGPDQAAPWTARGRGGLAGDLARKPVLKNRVTPEIEAAVVEPAVEQPASGSPPSGRSEG